METEIPNLLTSGGIAVVVLILIGALKAAAVNLDMARYGAILSIFLGVVLSFANALFGGVADDTSLTPIAVILTGILGGASASGIYSAGKGTSAAMS